MIERGVRPPLGGYSVPTGFFIFAKSSADGVEEAAEEALSRLRAGQSEMAISPYCGTNLLAGALIAGLLAGLVLYPRGNRMKRAPLVLLGSVAGALAGRPVGQETQRRYTTLPDLGRLEITGVHQLQLGRVRLFWVGTR